MAPLVRTAEYNVLQFLAERIEATPLLVARDQPINQLALTKAIDEGYVERNGDLIWLTDAGFDRLDELEG